MFPIVACFAGLMGPAKVDKGAGIPRPPVGMFERDRLMYEKNRADDLEWVNEELSRYKKLHTKLSTDKSPEGKKLLATIEKSQKVLQEIKDQLDK